jgi:hypothetical protein
MNAENINLQNKNKVLINNKYFISIIHDIKLIFL